jgi:hypothetical protein
MTITCRNSTMMKRIALPLALEQERKLPLLQCLALYAKRAFQCLMCVTTTVVSICTDYFPSFSNALPAILCGIVVEHVKSGIGKARMEGLIDRVIKRNVQKSRYITDTSVSALISF